MGTDMKTNAKRAMQELFGGKLTEAEPTLVEEEKAVVAAPKVSEAPSVGEPTVTEVAPAMNIQRSGPTIIGSETVITGSIKTSGMVEVQGTVIGDIDCADDVHIFGHVAGNINCSNYYHHAGAVRGDITASEDLEVESAAAIKGNIKGQNSSVDGRVAGNVSAVRSVELLDHAIVVGDIEANSFAMTDSAVLRGMIKLTNDSANMDDAFKGCFDF